MRTHRLAKQFFAAVIVLSAITQTVCAQRVRIHGRVSDENGEPVELATVNESQQMVSTMTDLNGRYDFSVPYRDTVEIVFRMIGHETRKRTLTSPADSISLDVVLPTSGYALEGVTISDMRRQMDANQIIELDRVRLMPDVSGGSVESFITTQAGVSSHNELSNQYNVRGGSFDENSIYVNGNEILRPLLVRSGQQEGLSFINPDMIESVSFSTGGFAAMYGDRMSSVLDITYRRPKKLESNVSASLLGASAYIGFGNDRFSLSNSLRYKTNRSLLNTMDTNGEYEPDFLDYQLYGTWRPSEGWDIEVLGNIASNSYRFTPSDRNTSFGTSKNPHTFTVYFDGWEKDLFRTMFGAVNVTRRIDAMNSVSLRFSTFDSDENETFDIMSQYWLDESGAQEQMSVGTFMQHARNYLDASVTSIGLSGNHRLTAHNIRWSMELKHENISENMREWEYRDSAGYMMPNVETGPMNMIYSLRSDQDIESNRLSMYVQDTWRINAARGLFTLNGGIRASYWNWNEELIVSPRFSVGFIPATNEDLTLRLSGGIYYQSPFYKELKDTVNAGGISSVSLNRGIKSQRSFQIVLGGDYHFRMFNRMFKFTVEAYYKKLSDLIPYNVDNVRVIYYGENCSEGRIYGIDTKLLGEFVPGAESWITLSLMKAQEHTDGRWIPLPTDQSYNMSMCFTDFFPKTDRWKMSLKGSLAGGLPFGPTHSGREKATFRAPAYRRIDIGMSYRLLNNEDRHINYGIAQPFRNVWLGLDCFNLFGINNVNSYYWVTDVTGTQFAVPNYLTGRQFNLRILADF